MLEDGAVVANRLSGSKSLWLPDGDGCKLCAAVGSWLGVAEGFPEGSIDGNELVEGTLDRDGWRLRDGTRVGLLLLVGLDDGATLVVGVKLGMCDGLSLGGKDGDEDGSIDGDRD